MTVKIWDISVGPISVDEAPDDEDFPEGCNYFIVCKTEIEGEMEEVNFWFEDFDSAYEWKKHFMKSIEPLVVDMPDDSGYN